MTLNFWFSCLRPSPSPPVLGLQAYSHVHFDLGMEPWLHVCVVTYQLNYILRLFNGNFGSYAEGQRAGPLSAALESPGFWGDAPLSPSDDYSPVLQGRAGR